MRKTPVYDVNVLRRLWAAGKTHQQIAAALGCSEMYVSQLRQRHNLPKRRMKFTPPVAVDPTEAEIAARAAQIRAKHLDELRRSDPKPSTLGNIRCVGWNGYQFDSFA